MADNRMDRAEADRRWEAVKEKVEAALENFRDSFPSEDAEMDDPARWGRLLHRAITLLERQNMDEVINKLSEDYLGEGY